MSNQPAYAALVVDDNWYNRDLSTLALRHVGYQVAEAQDGLEALKLLEEHTYDLLVLDLSMPEVDGATVLRKVRGQAMHKKMLVIVMTANPHMTTDEIDGEADYVMYKPINITEFAEFVGRLKQTRAPAC